MAHIDYIQYHRGNDTGKVKVELFYYSWELELTDPEKAKTVVVAYEWQKGRRTYHNSQEFAIKSTTNARGYLTRQQALDMALDYYWRKVDELNKKNRYHN